VGIHDISRFLPSGRDEMLNEINRGQAPRGSMVHISAVLERQEG
jgi:hypothetical protein